MTKQKTQHGDIIVVLLLIFLVSIFTGSQRIWADDETAEVQSFDSLEVKLPSVDLTSHFFVDSLCNVTDEKGSLDHFFNELKSLREGKDTVISVVQLGDSHIQAGYLSGRLMRLFHEDFGNAGRGLVVPLKLSRTNEPDDYFIRSTLTEWEKGRCTQAKPPVQTGLGGIAVKTQSKKVNMNLTIAEKNGEGYEFNQAVLFRHPDALPLIATGIPRDSVKTYNAKGVIASGMACDTFRFAGLTDSLFMRSHTSATHPNNAYYGFNLTNGRPGILFHSIGVNGSMFVNYTNASYVEQLAVLKPSLLIISLGTNETFGRRFTEAEFRGQVNAFITLIRRYNPHTAILLTTPPECFKRIRVNKKRVYVRNENTIRASRVLLEVAAKEGIACWDLFSTTGGKNSCEKWKKANLMGADRIHFTKEAYREQGSLLYRALMKDYNRYVSVPHVQPDSTYLDVIR